MALLAALSLLEIIWAVIGMGFVIAFAVHVCMRDPPVLLEDLIRYGKSKGGQRAAWMRALDVPKRWFMHFYVVAVVSHVTLFSLTLRALLLGSPFPGWLESLLVAFGSPTNNFPHGMELSVVLAQALMVLQVVRRLAECLCLSVYSNAIMHAVQYGYGMLYYVVIAFTLLCEGPSMGGKGVSVWQLLAQWRWYHVAGSVMFAWATLHHHRSHIILANLRKDKAGRVVHTRYVVPHGDWFELVSCPHYLSEILVYVAIAVVLGGVHRTWCVTSFMDGPLAGVHRCAQGHGLRQLTTSSLNSPPRSCLQGYIQVN
ncbi:polyprenol reductase isoform X1 [Lethenteron reissneri]|uniref:polyprenol reductase isoform X1 n=1 Tax=Lethenteron reissneri TaxID=7753 RepID=UPI002AB792AE|nr:polyprenol reductase isoform X1 [Lethenteron reissneri]